MERGAEIDMCMRSQLTGWVVSRTMGCVAFVHAEHQSGHYKPLRRSHTRFESWCWAVEVSFGAFKRAERIKIQAFQARPTHQAAQGSGDTVVGEIEFLVRYWGARPFWRREPRYWPPSEHCRRWPRDVTEQWL